MKEAPFLNLEPPKIIRPGIRPSTILRAWSCLVLLGMISAYAETTPAAPPSVGAEAGGKAEVAASQDEVEVSQDSVRVAVFNIQELTAEKILSEPLGENPQLISAGRIIRELDPDILLINEVDYQPQSPGSPSLPEVFWQRYVLGQNRLPEGARGENTSLRNMPPEDLSPEDMSPEDMADDEAWHWVYLPVNTGMPSGLDLNRNDSVDDPEDAWGFGRYPGQYGMALVSKYPVQRDRIRTFQGLRWISMPGHLMPDGRDGRPEWYDPEAAAVLRLSSKSHWDVPVNVDGEILHLLASHPTPPVFDGEEDRNGRRNHDEIRLWVDYVSGGEQASYIVDDRGLRGGLEAGTSFVVLGDLNADPHRPGPKGPPAIQQLLRHPRVQDPAPKSVGQRPAARQRIEAGDTFQTTSDYGRLDYLLPSANLKVQGSGIFLPPEGDPRRSWVLGETSAGDHQMLWLDLLMKGR